MSTNLRILPTALLLILSVAVVLLSMADPVAAGPLLQAEDPTPATQPVNPAPTPSGDSDDDTWSEPVNLSNSAIAGNPHLVLTTQDNTLAGITALWQETGVPGMAFATHDGQQWPSPQVAEFPFATGAYYRDLNPQETPPVFSPLLLHDEGNQRLHAIWTDENNILWHSQMAVEAAGDTFQAVQDNGLNAWSQRVQLAENAVGVNADFGPGPADASDEAATTVHISYIRQLSTEEEPSGVYYMQFDVDAGPSNTATTLLYPTRYAMALGPNNARTQLLLHQSSGQTTVLVGWELGPLQKIFIARSTDGGETWISESGSSETLPDAIVFDQRTPDDHPGATAPTNLNLASDGNIVLALWQAGHDDAPCTQYYDWSDDGGQTWHGGQPMLQSFLSCPSHVQLLTFPGAASLLFTVIDGRPYLQAWDSPATQGDNPAPTGAWSEPQPQDALISFTNPDTLQPVTLVCLQVGRPRSDTIIVVGCQEDGGKDIWTMQRTVQNLDDWFAASPWRLPTPVFNQSQDTNGLQLLTTDGNQAHAFWSDPAQQSISYARWDGEDCIASGNCSWTRPLSLVTGSQGSAGAPAVTVAPDESDSDVLILTWNSYDGAVYFSKASGDQALTAADWSTPQALPVPPGAHAIQPVIGYARGTIFVVYAVPLNEQRGLYLTTSRDIGATWSPPTAILDGADAGWHIVGSPQFALDEENGQIHLLVAEQTIGLQGTMQARALHYIRSQGDGLTEQSSFTAPHQLFVGTVSWYQLHLQQDQSETAAIIHALWQEPAAASSQELGADSGDTVALWSQRSSDGGQSWDLAQRILAPPGVTASASHQTGIHLLHATSDALQHWHLAGNSWQESPGLQWQNSTATTAGAYPHATLGAAVAPNSTLPGSADEGLGPVALLVLYDPPGQGDGQGPRFTLRSGQASSSDAEGQPVSAAGAPSALPAAGGTPLAAPADVNTETTAPTPTAGVAQTSTGQGSSTEGLGEAPGAGDVVQAVRQTAADPLTLILFAIIPAGLLVIAAGVVKLGLTRRKRG